MKSRSRTAFVAALVLALSAHAPLSAQKSYGAIRGQAADGSGGVLPGVTVTVGSEDGRAIAATVTDAAGEFAFDAVPAGPVTVTFQLAGFTTAVVRVAVEANATTPALARLELASLAETVVVSAGPPLDLSARPQTRPIPAEDLASVCGPSKPNWPSDALGTITSLRDDAQRTLYSKNDQVTVDGGTLDGLVVGRNLVVQRPYRPDRTAGVPAIGEHTAGVLQIVAADERSSLGVVVYACDAFRKGDSVAPFTPAPAPPYEATGIPVFEKAARVLFADEGSALGAPGRLMVIDRGESEAIRAGQRLTLFHRDGGRASVVGDAVVIAVRANSATIRVEHINDIFEPGDWAAPQRQFDSR